MRDGNTECMCKTIIQVESLLLASTSCKIDAQKFVHSAALDQDQVQAIINKLTEAYAGRSDGPGTSAYCAIPFFLNNG